jgi:uncharacterized protein (DUF924 family)
MDAFDEVLRFWLPAPPIEDHETMVRQYKWWFRGGGDSEIRARFGPTLERASRGALDRWAQAPRSRLALIIVLDQFSRSLHRDSAHAFAQDGKALALALEGLDNGHYAALQTPWEKTFFFMPLGHCEELRHLDTVVALADALAAQATAQARAVLQHSASQARAHRDVIARFGRRPHRNALLGRPSTPEELHYMATEVPVHLRRIALQ